MPPERIVRLPRADNFWSVGGPGPCGPDSEMFFDWGPEAGCGRAECQPGCECERFLEFWNLVFMEFELHTDGSLTPLPKQNIDTGMGLERAARILQQVDSVYDTDGYQQIMSWIAAESGVAYGDSPEATKAHRILADHGRGLTFLASEGVVPSNEGRGYVMRRIARRAVQQAGRIGLDSPFLARLADVVVEQMGDAYPELPEHRDEIARILTAEEESFSRTLVARPATVRGGRRGRRRDLGRGRLQAPRHVRLPVRAHPRAGARARAGDRRGGVHAADGAATRALPLRGCLRGGARRRAADGVRRLREDRGADGDRGARAA